MEKNYFIELNSVNVNDKTEQKNGLTYLAWAFAWGEIKKKHPDANYTVYENADGWNYFTDGRTCWVKTGVTINGIEHIEFLPIMNYNNKSIALESVTSFDVNKAIQRSLTKAVARHGLGLYVYAGEDLPEDERSKVEETLSTLNYQQQTQVMDAWVAKNGQVAGENIDKYGAFLKQFGASKTAEIKCSDLQKVLAAI